MQKTLHQAVRRILTALVRTLLRNGMAYGEFDQIARKCFADVAYRDFAPSGKKQTVSNIAIVTGLNRKEVKRMLELDGNQTDSGNRQYNRSIRVIGGWINDLDFLHENGQPRDLPYEGSQSFASLVRKYSGDMPVVAMQEALVKSGNISISDENYVRLLSHAYVPADDPLENIAILGVDTSQLIDTINHNITAASNHLRFQRKASNHQVSVAAIPAVKRLLARKGQAFLEEVDHYLSEHQTDDGDTSELSVGLFYHESSDDKLDNPK